MSPFWMLVVGFEWEIFNLLFDKNIIGKKNRTLPSTHRCM